jgi:hypothetical protein
MDLSRAPLCKLDLCGLRDRRAGYAIRDSTSVAYVGYAAVRVHGRVADVLIAANMAAIAILAGTRRRVRHRTDFSRRTRQSEYQ